MSSNQHDLLFPCLLRLAQLSNEVVDKVSIHTALGKVVEQQTASSTPLDPVATVEQLVSTLQLPKATWHVADGSPLQFPLLVHSPKEGWGILRGRNGYGKWVLEYPDAQSGKWLETANEDMSALKMVKLKLTKNFNPTDSKVLGVIVNALLQYRWLMLEIVVAGVLVNVLALATSLYSMQVYDRVVPTGAVETLLALSIGVFGTIAFELILKLIKSKLSERLADSVDAVLSREVYAKFLAIRLDQLPSSVGGLASQLRGYETVRSFLSTIPSQILIDFPFMFLFAILIMVFGGWIGLIPLVFLCLSAALGLIYKRKVEALTRLSTNASNLKTGLLVETIEGAETIKSGQGGWRMLSKWLHTTDSARQLEFETKYISEHSQHFIATVHQVSYVLLVATGALQVAKGHMTMGSLIACTILSGRVLGPIASLPNMLIQWAHSLAALQSLDKFWALKSDHDHVDQPVVLEDIRGDFLLENVQVSYANRPALNVGHLHIRGGEKVAILGPIGSGKTTLLRLLSGMYKPQKGTVKLDDVDLSMLSKPALAEQIGFLQQEGRLFAGSIRDNLILGLIDPGDQTIIETAKRTGLHQTVLTKHPQGLNLPIQEGGVGLSGGQKQLTNLTRVFLRKPKIWLLDEPTACLDRDLEMLVLSSLRATLKPTDTFLLVTHKPELLGLVDRIIVVANHQIVMDGPKADILSRLSAAVPA